MTRVSDVMTKDVVTMRNDATLAEALTYLATQHISGVAVMDARHQLVGVVSRSDIMEAEAEISDPEIRGRFLDNTLARDVMTAGRKGGRKQGSAGRPSSAARRLSISY